jgi:WD40 repeat protein
MLKRPLLFTLIAVLGFLVGAPLDQLVGQAPRKVLVVGQDMQSARLSPNGRYIAGLGRTPRNIWFVQIWDDRGQVVLPVQKLPTSPGRFPSMSWREDSGELAVAAKNEVWLFQPQAHSKTILPAAPQVRAVQYSGETLLARTDTNTFIWHARTHKPVWRLAQNHLLHAVLDPTGQQLATGCFEDGVRVFSLKNKRQILHFEPGTIACGLQFSHGGQWLTIGVRYPGARQQDKIVTFDLARKKAVGPKLSTPQLKGLDVAEDGLRIVSSQSGRACVWEPTEGRRIAQRDLDGRLLESLSRDGRWVASVVGKAEPVIWKSQDPTSEHRLSAQYPATDVIFQSATDLLLVDGRITHWKLR